MPGGAEQLCATLMSIHPNDMLDKYGKEVFDGLESLMITYTEILVELMKESLAVFKLLLTDHMKTSLSKSTWVSSNHIQPISAVVGICHALERTQPTC